MACRDVLRIGMIGTIIKIPIFECINGEPVIVDISAATILDIVFKKEGSQETIITKTGSIYTGGINGDGTDGIVKYIVEDEFLVEGDAGKLRAYVNVGFPDGSIFPSSITTFLVKENY